MSEGGLIGPNLFIVEKGLRKESGNRKIDTGMRVGRALRWFVAVLLFFSSACSSRPAILDNKTHTFFSKEIGLKISFPAEWRLSEKTHTLFVADFEPARISQIRLTATDEGEIPRMEDYLKVVSFQGLPRRMQRVSLGEISHYQTFSSGKLVRQETRWEETVWLGERKGQAKVFHTYSTSVGLKIVQLHFEFPVVFYNNPLQFIFPVLDNVVIAPPKSPPEDFARAYRTVGEFYKSRKLWNEAIGAFEQALLRKPKDADLHILLGESYFQNAQIDQAEKAFLDAIRLASQNGRAHQGLGEVYFKKGLPNQGISSIKRAVNFSPENLSLYAILGNAYLGQGRAEEAIQTFQKLIRLNGKAAEGYLGLGKAYLSMDLYEQAVLELEKALQYQPQSVEPHCLLEKAYTQLASADAEKEGELCKKGAPPPP